MVWLSIHLYNFTFEFSGSRAKSIMQLLYHSSVKQFSAVFCGKNQMHNQFADAMSFTEGSLQQIIVITQLISSVNLLK